MGREDEVWGGLGGARIGGAWNVSMATILFVLNFDNHVDSLVSAPSASKEQQGRRCAVCEKNPKCTLDRRSHPRPSWPPVSWLKLCHK